MTRHSPADYRRAIAKACTPKDIELVVRKLITEALRGDVRAAKLLFDRVLGRVPQTIHLEGEVDVKTPSLENLDEQSRRKLRDILVHERERRAQGNGTPAPSDN